MRILMRTYLFNPLNQITFQKHVINTTHQRHAKILAHLKEAQKTFV